MESTLDDRDGSVHVDRADRDQETMDLAKVRVPKEQEYYTRGLTIIGPHDDGEQTSSDGVQNCMLQRNKQSGGTDAREDDDEDGEHFICIVGGKDGEALPYPIVGVSVASASTLPENWRQHVKLRETAEPS